jgi:NAD(P)-dependent dehydrogenase (short-subunit alcohol dehydrogenase family)
MHDLTGKVALILGIDQSTPEGQGISSAIAVLFARQGAKGCGGNRTLNSTRITQDRIHAAHGICEIMEADATSWESVKGVVDARMAAYGRIDILVNNAGQSVPGDLSSMDEAT